MSPRRRLVLLVEDDESDRELMELAVREGRGLAELRAVSDGAQALDFLRRRGAFADAPAPELVLLDWRLPRVGGDEVLRQARADPALRLLPVIVLTTSSSERDRRTAYELGANAFVTKPTGLERVRELVRLIEGFWLDFAARPAEAA